MSAGRILMVSPEYFRVDYAINPYMVNSAGVLNTIDRNIAIGQWEFLKRAYESLGYLVETLEGHPELPDMVFAANQSFPFWSESKKRSVLMSRMRSPQRAPEVSYFRSWYEAHGYEVHELETDGTFEGNGDALIHPNRRLVWGGYGPRTDAAVYDEMERRFGFTVNRLALQTEDFYHLDTCFAILDEDVVAIQPEAFDDEGRKKIRAGFSKVIELDMDECLRSFAGNFHCPDGRNVLLNPGSPKLKAQLKTLGFVPHEVATSEFMKSGGSVFCLKMVLP